MEDVFLPIGIKTVESVHFSPPCAYCGKTVERERTRIRRALNRGWGIFCGLPCFRKNQTKYPGLTAREKIIKYQEVTKINRKKK
jgi:hypothetical protein